MCCAAVEILAPYIEFEYGHRLAPERFWKSRPSAAQKGDSSSSGPNANFLEIMYMQVALPEDPHYNPQMGCRGRDTAKVASLLPGNSAVEAALDPIVGVGPGSKSRPPLPHPPCAHKQLEQLRPVALLATSHRPSRVQTSSLFRGAQASARSR